MSLYKIYIANAGAPTSGLSPIWQSLYWIDGSVVVSQPVISAVGGGWYKYDFSPSADALGVVDATSALTSETDRYIPIDMTMDDFSIQNLDVVISSRSTFDPDVYGSLSANVVEVNGSSITISDFKNSQNEIYTASISGAQSAIDSYFTFTNGMVASFVSGGAVSASVNVSEVTDDIFNKLIDTKTFEEVIEILLSMSSGKIVRNDKSFTYYKQDNVTPVFTLLAANSERSRS